MSVSPLGQKAEAAVAAPEVKTGSITIAMVGSGGDGVVLLGHLLLQAAAKQGLYGMMVQSYGPQIRGGESAVVLRLGESEIQYEGDEVDVLLCFRTGDMQRFQGTVRLSAGSHVILDAADQGELPVWLGFSGTPLRYPFARIENGVEVEGEPRNILGMALLCNMMGWSQDLVRQTLTERFGHRPAVLARNLAAIDRAWGPEPLTRLPRLRGESGVTLEVESGNEATARGAMNAGLRFFAGYPITPSAEILETLIAELPKAGGTLIQAEDEMAAMGMVIGASFAGVPAMSATSGPGLSLMTEMIGLSSMAEIPTVVVDCQRAGPATGMPSRTEQADLDHAIFGGHGDFPRAVLGVFDVVHAHDVMFKAFHLAESYQLPVLVMSDAYIAQRRQVHAVRRDLPPAPARKVWQAGDAPLRFKLEGDAVVTPFRVPGTPGGTYLAAGIEHNAEGYPSADTQTHHQMNVKRFLKMDAIARETAGWFRTLGAPGARRGLLAWGSSYGVLRDWLLKHPDYRAFLPEIIHPFPLAAFEDWRRGTDWLGVVELSYRGQLRRYLAGLTDMTQAVGITRSGGVALSGPELTTMVEGAQR
jgi:2-oxoglutarate ferredoxin oxidoreductase subunit alpha